MKSFTKKSQVVTNTEHYWSHKTINRYSSFLKKGLLNCFLNTAGKTIQQ